MDRKIGRELDLAALIASIEFVPVAVILSESRTHRVVAANAAAADLFGYTAAKMQALSIDDLTHPDFQPELAANFASTARAGGLRTIKRYSRADDSAFTGQLVAHRLGERGLVAAVVTNMDDSDRLRTEIFASARIDPLTGLLRREAFFESAGLSTSMFERYGLIYVDLNDFKSVNDVHGHPMGDQVLATLGRRLRDCFRKTDLVARVGGDEFAAFVHTNPSAEELATLANRLLRWIREPVAVGDTEVRPDASLGVALFDHGVDLSSAVAVADRLMYQAKRQPGSQSELTAEEIVERFAL